MSYLDSSRRKSLGAKPAKPRESKTPTLGSRSRSTLSSVPSKLRTSQSSRSANTSNTSISSVSSSKGAVSKRPSKVVVSQPPKVKKEFALPAFSVPHKKKVTESEIEKLKKKTIRRNAPPGEDLKAIKEILKTTKGQKITVQEFIRLIAPSTVDNGECLRAVLNDEVESFRKLARKVYDMITADNSDVLLNEQLQLIEYYKERKALINTRMMSYIEQIYAMAPNFNFDRFAAEGQKYLDEIIPIPQELKVEPEEIEMMKRQAAYHRLHWLQSEGERLHQENNSLKKRLKEMKRLHMEEQKKMAQMEKVAEEKKESLEAAQAEKRETLEILNQSLEKSIIKQELSIRQTQEAASVTPAPTIISKSTGAIKKVKSKAGIKKLKRPKWNEAAAGEIESQVLEESKQSELAKVTKGRKKQTSPFHYSPIKSPSPSQAPKKELSPFHFSPPKTPPKGSPFRISPVKTPTTQREPGAPKSPFHYSPTFPDERRRKVPPPPPPTEEEPQLPTGRRGAAPRDSWGGFY